MFLFGDYYPAPNMCHSMLYAWVSHEMTGTPDSDRSPLLNHKTRCNEQQSCVPISNKTDTNGDIRIVDETDVHIHVALAKRLTSNTSFSL